MHASPRDDGLIPSKRIRRPLRLALICLAVALLLETGVLAGLVARGVARDAQVARLACQLVKYTPPGTLPGDDVRSAYGCGPYQVPTATPTASTSTVTATRSVSPVAGRPPIRHRARPSATVVPRPTVPTDRPTSTSTQRRVARHHVAPTATSGNTPRRAARHLTRNRPAAAPSTPRTAAPATARTRTSPRRQAPAQGVAPSTVHRATTLASPPTRGGLICTVGGLVGLPLC